jgi:hypothetical protein
MIHPDIKRSVSTWTPDELQQLKASYHHAPLARDLLPLFPTRTINQIRCKARHIGLFRVAVIPPQTPLDIRPTAAAYIAGFLDGEGTITIGRSMNTRRVKGMQFFPRAFFYNSDRPVLEWIQTTISEIPSALRVRNENKKRNPNGKDVLELKVASMKHIMRLLITIRPYLIIKARQADLVLEFCNTRILYSEYTPRDFEIVDALRALNRRGRPVIS